MATPTGRRSRPRSRSAPPAWDDSGRAASRRRSGRALIGLAEAVTAGLSPQQIVDLVVVAAATLTGEATVHLWLVTEDGQELKLAAASGVRPGKNGVPLPPVMKIREGLAGAVARSREPIALASLRSDRRLARAAWTRDQGLVSFAGVPLMRADRLLGVLCLFTWRRHRFTRHEVDLLRSFANHAAVALENAALFEASTSRLRRLETLREIQGEILQQRDPEALLGLISRRATELLQGGSATVYLLDGAAGVLRAHASYNIGDWVRDVPIPLGTGIVGLVALRREGMVVNDYPRSPHAIAPFRDLAWALLAQPLVHGATLQGVIIVRRETVDRPFSQPDLDQLGDFAVQASIALENARLLRLASARAERVKAAADVGQLLASTLDADRILDLIAEKCREILRAEAFGLFRLDPDERLRYARGFGLDEAFMREHTLALGEGVLGKAAQERRSIDTPDILADPAIVLSPEARARIEGQGSRAIVGVPILIREELLGALAVHHAPGVRVPPEEIEFLETLAHHAAAALDNARLFAQTRRAQETAETLYEEARRREAEALALFDVSRLINATLDPERVLDLIVEKVRDLMGVPACGIFRLDPQQTLRYVRGAGLSAEFVKGLTVPLGQGTSGRSVAERAPVWTADILADLAVPLNPATRALVEQEGYRAALSVPIEIKGVPFGCLATYRWERHAPRPDEIATLASLATLAAVALENARLYEETRTHVGRLESLNQINRAVSASLRLDEVLAQLAQAAGALFGVPLVVFWVADEERRTLTRRASHGHREFLSHLPEHVAYGHGGVGWVAQHRTPLLEVSVENDSRLLGREWALSVGITSFSGIPALLGDRLLGVLVIGGRREAPFCTGDQALLDTLMGQAAIAIENARLYEAAQRHYEELQTAQEQLVQTEKLRALGEMASGVAHDFNNALAAILGRVQLILRRVEDPTIRRWLEIVERAALDASQTVRRIQEFTRIRRDQPTETVDLNQVVRDAVEMTQTRWRDETQSRGLDVRVVTDLGAVPAVEGHPAELREALTNLILNAVDALPRDGAITITTRLAGDGVDVSVADTGVGMSDEVRRRIFEPFFSTKGPRGTGLGLAVVYGIVSRHGGQVSVESKEGVGSTFTLRLRVGRGGGATRTTPLAPVSDSAARVLVIDDEEEVREALADMLRVNNHEVVVARHGAEGLECFRAAPFDLVLTDLAMPGMSGWQVALSVKAARPDVPVVLVTGWGVELPPEQLSAHGVDRVMTKPFELQDVLGVVASFRETASWGGYPAGGRPAPPPPDPSA